ncbi:MAG: DUF6600 domain-containing protein [Thermoanaerobaculia bacterium]
MSVSFAAPLHRADASGSVSISFFYDELSPHGDWVTVGSYGHCWRPRGIDRNWQPYLNGEWLYTENGWTWVSYDPWGGDPYHYGTWSRSDAYGWVWIPGTIWAPAWVTWYVGDNDIGWAPVPPSFSVGYSGYAGPPVTVSRSSYVFVPATQFVGVNVGTVRVPVTQNATLLARTRPVTRFAASGGVLTSGGPTVVQMERVTKRKIARVSVGDAHTKAVPLDAGLRGRRGPVIAPAAERAKFIASPGAAKVAHETSPAARQSATVKHEGSPAAHEKARVAPEKPVQHEKTIRARESASAPAQKKAVPHEQTAPAPQRVEPAKSQKVHARAAEPAASIAKPAAPARERRDAPAPRVEAVSPPHGHESVVTSPAHQAPAPKAAPPQHAEKHQPDAAPQGGEAQAPKKEHGREKGE